MKRIVLAILIAATSACSADSPTATDVLPAFDLNTQKHGKKHVKIKHGGRVKHYKVKVDTAAKVIQLETFMEECQQYSLTCYDAWVDESIAGSSGYGGEPVGDAGPFFCPPTLHGSVVYPHNLVWRGHHFPISANMIREQHLPNTIWNVPRARYAIPLGPWESTDGEAVLWNGSVTASCWIKQDPAGPFGYTGFVAWSRIQGNVKEFGPDYGGESEMEIDGENVGSSETWEYVLYRFEEYGECTEGWLIYVNNRQVC